MYVVEDVWLSWSELAWVWNQNREDYPPGRVSIFRILEFNDGEGDDDWNKGDEKTCQNGKI